MSDPRETREYTCSQRGSAAVLALGRLRAARTEIRSEYPCRASRRELVLLRHIELTTSPRESLFPDDGGLQ